MPIEYWEPPVTERQPDRFIMDDGAPYQVKRFEANGASHIEVMGGIVCAHHWEQFDRCAREYLGLPAPYKRRENKAGTSPGVTAPDNRVPEPQADAAPRQTYPVGPISMYISDHALKTHLKKPGASFNCAGTVWERRGDGLLWHVGGPLPEGMGESLDNDQALAAYNGKSVTVTE